MKQQFPFISIIIPMRNEENYIEKCIKSVLNQDYPKNKFEIIIVDGGSTDNSIKIVRKFIKNRKNIKLLGSTGVNCPAAMNIGIKVAKGNIISKVDAHGFIASNYLTKNIYYLNAYKEKNVKCVGGHARHITSLPIANSNIYSRASFFGVGAGIYSEKEKLKITETVQCGTYIKDILLKVGLFDESLQFGEDEEVNWRIIKAGYKIMLSSEIKFYYYPRNSFILLYKQYFNYGSARVKVLIKHPDFFKIKHVIPSIFIIILFMTLLSGAFLRINF